jgi:hypothetical protein
MHEGAPLFVAPLFAFIAELRKRSLRRRLAMSRFRDPQGDSRLDRKGRMPVYERADRIPSLSGTITQVSKSRPSQLRRARRCTSRFTTSG